MEQPELLDKIKRLPQEPSPDQTTLHKALSDYAIQHAGTNADLDPDLEAAAIEQLLQSDK
jgi:hypothetical protein